MLVTKEELEHKLPENIREALGDVRVAFNHYAVAHGDPLMPEGEIADTILTDILVWMIQAGEDYEARISTARISAKEITGLN